MINCSSYFFEESKRGYIQYPQDFTADLFKSYRNMFDSDAQLVIHRHPDHLMYYTYMKRLSEDNGKSFFGISIVINGLETTNFKSLFKLFERFFQQIISEGEILSISPEGDFVTKDIIFSDYANTFIRLSSSIKSKIEEGAHFFYPMLPVNYSSSEDDYATFSIEEGESTFRQNQAIYNKFIITKNKKGSSSELNGLAAKIQQLNDQIEYLKMRNAELEKKSNNKSILNKWKAIAFGCITIGVVLLICFIYCYSCGFISFRL